MTLPIERPYIFLRCQKCSRKTGHVMINTSFQFRFGECQIEETYECQECGEVRKIYELTTSHAFDPIHNSEKQRSKRPQEKQKILKEKREKESEEKKDYIEVKIRKKKK